MEVGDPTEGEEGVASPSWAIWAHESAILSDSLMQYLELNQTKKKVKVRKITNCSSNKITCCDRVAGGVSSSPGDWVKSKEGAMEM